MFSNRRQPIVPSRRVTSLALNEQQRKPKTRILLCIRKECAALTVRLRRELPEEELIVLRCVLLSKGKANWIGHISRRNCLLRQVTEGKIKGGIEVTGRLGRRRKKLLDDLKERTEYSHLKQEAPDRTMWRSGFGRGFGPVVRQTANECFIGCLDVVTLSSRYEVL
jgi:hypothetical protein